MKDMKPAFWIVFILGYHHLVIPDHEANFETVQNIESAGFIEIWDSAPSEFEGAQYAAQNYGAYVPVRKKVL